MTKEQKIYAFGGVAVVIIILYLLYQKNKNGIGNNPTYMTINQPSASIPIGSNNGLPTMPNTSGANSCGCGSGGSNAGFYASLNQMLSNYEQSAGNYINQYYQNIESATPAYMKAYIQNAQGAIMSQTQHTALGNVVTQTNPSIPIINAGPGYGIVV